MTTNAIDRRLNILASDSRWSYFENDHLIFVDDTGFEKIAHRSGGAIICAGDGVLINAWRMWFMQPDPSSVPIPSVSRDLPNGELVSLVVTLISAPQGELLFSNGWYLSLDDHALFAGTGAEPAYKCFTVNRCAKTAVHTASTEDIQTGGSMKYVELQTGNNNLTPGGRTLQDAEADLFIKGKAMNLTTKNVISFQEYVAGAGNTQGGAAPGASNLSAPTGQPYREWAKEDKQRVVDAMRKIVEVEKEQNKD